MSGFAFASPAILFALIALPAIWWLLRLTPPRPRSEVFPPLRILATVLKREETPAQSPWWLTLLRILLATAVILAIADPVINPRNNPLASGGPLVMIVDNSWASAEDWERRVQTADLMIGDAADAEIPVSLTFTAEATHDAVPTSAIVARERLAAARPKPLVPDRLRAARAVTEALNGTQPGTLAYLSDGIAAPTDGDMLTALAGLSPRDMQLIEGDGQKSLALTGATNNAAAMSVAATRLKTETAQNFSVNALDQQGRSLATGTLDFAAGANTATATINAPFELRNDFARLSVDGIATAGATHLLDDGFKRRRIALLSGDSGNDFQPLLLPLYYISRALEPYADLIQPRGGDLAASLREILTSNPSAIVMADVGRLPEESYAPLRQWLNRGGTLIRFAGPRLAAAPADDPLVPVRLRQGERALGGAMSWADPQPLAAFPNFGPFAGMAAPTDITVRRQVLAEPTPDLNERTWASLADGTPLVTTREVEAGRIVLFHVSADATWSNLPISGNFVEMLRRLVQLSRAGGAAEPQAGNAGAPALPPYRLLTADGILSTEVGSARPLAAKVGVKPIASLDNPPGLYGSEEGFTAVNLLAPNTTLAPFDASAASFPIVRQGLAGGEAWSLRPALFAAAFFMLLLDTLIVLFMNGGFARLPRAGRAAAILAVMVGAFAFAPTGDLHAQTPSQEPAPGAQAQAQPPAAPQPGQPAPPAASQQTPDPNAPIEHAKPGDESILERLDTTHLAYVITGEGDVDRISEQGLDGLSQFMTYRTTLEPGAPVGVDITKDELSFYPIIYWPVSATAPMPSAAAISRIDAYMRSGGTVLFDTRDQFSSLDGSGGTSPNGERLQQILANIDIPPLEPTPNDHVLARSFYLLNNFPGRYNGSPLWVEARQDARNQGTALSSSGDGVTPILITGNDFAGAWAVDAQGNSVLPTVPPDDMQREHAFRSGVNIMMYMLTGNYKADQVHVPALLERLGQ